MVDCRFYPQLLGLLCSLSHLLHAIFFSSYSTSCHAIVASHVVFSFYSLSRTCTKGFTNTFLLLLTPCLLLSLFLFFWLPLSCPLLEPVKSLCFSSLSRCCRLSLYGHIIFCETGRGWRDAANISPYVSHGSFFVSYLLWVCVCEREGRMHACVRVIPG